MPDAHKVIRIALLRRTITAGTRNRRPLPETGGFGPMPGIAPGAAMRPFFKLAFLAVLTWLIATAAHAEQVTVTFIQTNDIDKFEGSGERGGFARLNAVVRGERAK